MAITFKKLSGDTEVIPNPTLDGTETALSGLQIDGVKYAMGGGGLYNHHIYFNYFRKGDGSCQLFFTITTSTPEPFTPETLRVYMYNNNNPIQQSVNGYIQDLVGTDDTMIPIFKLIATNSEFMWFNFSGSSNGLSLSWVTVKDTVIEV